VPIAPVTQRRTRRRLLYGGVAAVAAVIAALAVSAMASRQDPPVMAVGIITEPGGFDT